MVEHLFTQRELPVSRWISNKPYIDLEVFSSASVHLKKQEMDLWICSWMWHHQKDGVFFVGGGGIFDGHILLKKIIFMYLL